MIFSAVGAYISVQALIAHQCFDEPRIIERIDDGGVALPRDLLNHLTIECFNLMAHFLLGQGAQSGVATIADIVPMIRARFSHREAERVITALAHDVDPDIQVNDHCIVGNEDDM